jgi:hypothetical protein
LKSGKEMEIEVKGGGEFKRDSTSIQKGTRIKYKVEIEEG